MTKSSKAQTNISINLCISVEKTVKKVFGIAFKSNK